jgi:hypothetical protein
MTGTFSSSPSLWTPWLLATQHQKWCTGTKMTHMCEMKELTYMRHEANITVLGPSSLEFNNNNGENYM